jgi:hypothetical protein
VTSWPLLPVPNTHCLLSFSDPAAGPSPGLAGTLPKPGTPGMVGMAPTRREPDVLGFQRRWLPSGVAP